MKSPVRLAVLCSRAIGERFCEGLLASRARRHAEIELRQVIGLAPQSKYNRASDRNDVQVWAERFGIAAVSLPDPKMASQVILDSSLDILILAGWPFKLANLEAIGQAGVAVFGLHPRRLPEGRGRSPIPWAIEVCERTSTLSLFRVEERLDCGPVALERVIPIEQDEDATSLYLKVSNAHFSLGLRFADSVASGIPIGRVQSEDQATVWPHRGPASRELYPTMTRDEAVGRIRAQSPPFPPALIPIAGGIFRVDSYASQRVWALGLDEGLLVAFADGPLRVVTEESRWSHT